MLPRMTESTVVYEFFVNKMGNKDSDTYVGDEGMIFYDPVRGDLRISNDVTPGGIPLLQALLAADAGNTSSNTSGGGGGGGLPGENSNTVVYNFTAMEAQGVINYGNVKQGFQGADHFGWVLLDGRAVSTLTATQQAIAQRLGWTVALPNATGRITKMTGAVPGSTGGSDTITLTQRNLPNVTLVGSSGGIAHEDHAGATLGYGGKWLYNSGGDFSVSTSVSLNPFGQLPTTVENAYMALNTFVYLGL